MLIIMRTQVLWVFRVQHGHIFSVFYPVVYLDMSKVTDLLWAQGLVIFQNCSKTRRP